MDTSREDSIISRVIRDNKNIEKFNDPEIKKQFDTWSNGINILKKTLEEIV